ncbi:DUF4303 domain-containing protein [Catellatospora sichuanensis]|uniref:DUF4303 domain-containing protein n=1 Tax=Catellatospora sichuanensis TaxID=1969805 RepID=UPI001FE2EB40|nr:DUF4303 domain-containing protein [Catellatospora sichuanensis]
MTFDWAAFERELEAGLVATVKAAIAVEPDQRWYAAAMAEIYAEEDGVICLPLLGVNSEEALAESDGDVRWHPPDWPTFGDLWLPEDRWAHWQQALTAQACRGTPEEWTSTYELFLSALVRVAKRSARTLRARGITDRRFVVVLVDQERYEAMIERCLTKQELRRHFPEFDGEAVERTRVAALPEPQRLAIYVSKLDAYSDPVGGDYAVQALRAAGPAAFQVLTVQLSGSCRAWQAAKLLAEIGGADDRVVAALDAALTQHAGPDQSWIASALTRLGRPDLVEAKLDWLPEDTVAAAMTAPYNGFRDDAVDPLPLDYRPLERFLARHPTYEPALVAYRRVGTTSCRIRPYEVDEAIRGLASPYALVRHHAVDVLGNRRLGPRLGKRVLPALADVMARDLVPSVRRAAVYSLLWWKKDSRQYVDAVARALDDPDAGVREAAAYWIAQQNLAAGNP